MFWILFYVFLKFEVSEAVFKHMLFEFYEFCSGGRCAFVSRAVEHRLLIMLRMD